MMAGAGLRRRGAYVLWPKLTRFHYRAATYVDKLL